MHIRIYSKPNCPWCVKAKELMKNLHLDYEEFILNVDYTKDELRQLVYEHKPVSASMSPPLTVPQIFVNMKLIGGYEDFAEYCEATGIMGLQN